MVDTTIVYPPGEAAPAKPRLERSDEAIRHRGSQRRPVAEDANVAEALARRHWAGCGKRS
jgi:hypothetical protein